MGNIKQPSKRIRLNTDLHKLQATTSSLPGHKTNRPRVKIMASIIRANTIRSNTRLLHSNRMIVT